MNLNCNFFLYNVFQECVNAKRPREVISFAFSIISAVLYFVIPVISYFEDPVKMKMYRFCKWNFIFYFGQLFGGIFFLLGNVLSTGIGVEFFIFLIIVVSNAFLFFERGYFQVVAFYKKMMIERKSKKQFTHYLTIGKKPEETDSFVFGEDVFEENEKNPLLKSEKLFSFSVVIFPLIMSNIFSLAPDSEEVLKLVGFILNCVASLVLIVCHFIVLLRILLHRPKEFSKRVLVGNFGANLFFLLAIVIYGGGERSMFYVSKTPEIVFLSALLVIDMGYIVLKRRREKIKIFSQNSILDLSSPND